MLPETAICLWDWDVADSFFLKSAMSAVRFAYFQGQHCNPEIHRQTDNVPPKAIITRMPLSEKHQTRTNLFPLRNGFPKIFDHIWQLVLHSTSSQCPIQFLGRITAFVAIVILFILAKPCNLQARALNLVDLIQNRFALFSQVACFRNLEWH